MKLRYFSDLHLEFLNANQFKKFVRKIPTGINEVCILAGDIGNPYESNYRVFMDFVSSHFKRTFVIPGNHEYYNRTKTMQETNEYMRDYFRSFRNIRFLNDESEVYENHCFIGTTLWSKIVNPEYTINDVLQIPQFDYMQYNRLNRMSVDFLEDALFTNQNCIVITHHVPSDSLIHVKYKTPKMRPYNQWFYCNMDDTIETYHDKIKCWIYGHTHTPSTNIVHGIPFLCNPMGYPNENPVFDLAKMIRLENKN